MTCESDPFCPPSGDQSLIISTNTSSTMSSNNNSSSNDNNTMEVNDYGPDVCIRKVEDFPTAHARYLLTHKDVSKKDKQILRHMIRARGKDGLEVYYKHGKTTKATDTPGRWFVIKAGLALLSRKARNSLMSGFYWDLDIVACQPTILLQLAQRNGWNCPVLADFIRTRESKLKELSDDRDKAKQMTTPLFYGQRNNNMPDFFIALQRELDQLMTFVAVRYSNQVPPHAKKGPRSIMAYVLQHEEYRCLMAIDRAVAQKGRSLDVLIHDGGGVRQLDDEEKAPEDIIPYVQQKILADAGYMVELKFKDVQCYFPFEEEGDDRGVYIPSNIIVDDTFAAERFLELYEGHVVMDSKVLYVFDSNTGIWCSGESDVRNIINACGTGLIFIQVNPDTGREKIYNYSRNIENNRKAYIALTMIAPVQNGYFVKRIDSGVGKLLFQDGYYDFTTGEFTVGFDPEIVFYNAVGRPFPLSHDKEAEDFIMNTLFCEPFANPEVGKHLLYRLARGIAGHFRDKILLLCLGRRDSGKGTMCSLMKNAIGLCYGPFQANSLLARRGDCEATKALSWINTIKDKRISISNEISIDEKRPVDGNIIKTMVSGGDEIQLRTNFKDETTVINQSQLVLFMNDMPRISPADEAFRSRVLAYEFKYSFVANPTEPWHKSRIDGLKEKLSKDNYCDAFIHLIMEAYRSGDPGVPEECLKFKDELIPTEKTQVRDLLEDRYVVTGVDSDFVSAAELSGYLRANKIVGSDNFIGRVLSDIGLGKGQKKIAGKNTKGRTGIRKRTREDDEDGEDQKKQKGEEGRSSAVHDFFGKP